MYVIYATATLAVNLSDTLKQLIRICAVLVYVYYISGNYIKIKTVSVSNYAPKKTTNNSKTMCGRLYVAVMIFDVGQDPLA
jgi:hypothetical protein